MLLSKYLGFRLNIRSLSCKEPALPAVRRLMFDPWIRKWQCTQYSWKYHGQEPSRLLFLGLQESWLNLVTKPHQSKYCLPAALSGSVVRNPHAHAGDTGQSLTGKILHAEQLSSVPQLLSLCSRVWEPQLLSPHATTAEAHDPIAHAPQQESYHN